MHYMPHHWQRAIVDALTRRLNEFADIWASVHYWDTDIRHLGQSVNTRAIGSPQHL